MSLGPGPEVCCCCCTQAAQAEAAKVPAGNPLLGAMINLLPNGGHEQRRPRWHLEAKPFEAQAEAAQLASQVQELKEAAAAQADVEKELRGYVAALEACEKEAATQQAQLQEQLDKVRKGKSVHESMREV
eukprot:scaffold71008_cov20-Tisochrysis_lutea.AAC.5